MFWFMGVLFVSQNIFFQNALCFKDCELCEIYISWSLSNTCGTFWGYISLYVAIFVKFFVWEFLQKMFYLYNMYHVQCVYFSGIQGSMICVVDRHQILCDVICSDHIVLPTCMVHGLQLQYWHSFSIYHISQTIWHRYRWYFLLHILEHFCHCKFQFSFFVYVMIKL